MKLRQNGIVSFSIRLAAFQARGVARVKLQKLELVRAGPFTFCRLGWVYCRLCWVSLHSTQPTCCRCYCQMRNPTTADFGPVRQKFLFRFDRQFFWPAAGLNLIFSGFRGKISIRILFYPGLCPEACDQVFPDLFLISFRQLFLNSVVDILQVQLFGRLHLLHPDDVIPINRFDDPA